MGYRSDILLVVYPDHDENLYTHGLSEEGIAQKLRQINAEKYEMLKILMGTKFKLIVDEWGGEFIDRDRRFVIRHEDIKYYINFEDVTHLEQFKDEIVKLGYCMEFARTGEERDDTEFDQRGNHCEYAVSVNRTLVLN